MKIVWDKSNPGRYHTSDFINFDKITYNQSVFRIFQWAKKNEVLLYIFYSCRKYASLERVPASTKNENENNDETEEEGHFTRANMERSDANTKLILPPPPTQDPTIITGHRWSLNAVDELQTSRTLYTYNSSLTSQFVLLGKNQFTYFYHYNGQQLILKLNFQMKNNEIKLILVNTGSNLNLASCLDSTDSTKEGKQKLVIIWKNKISPKLSNTKSIACSP